MMKNTRLHFLLGIVFGILSLVCFPVWAAVTLGTMAENLLVPTEILTKLMIFASYVGGVAICLTALVQYNIHRQNPKLVPLTTPVVLVLIGIILLFLPYISTIFDDNVDETSPTKKGYSKGNTGGGLELPPLKGESSYPQQQSEPESSPYQEEQSPPNSQGGHWSDSPKYK